MLTKKGKYGLKALIYLSRLAPGEVALINTIAEADESPKKFLEAILIDLKKAGFVHSKKGKGGGYLLARQPEEIHVGQVIRALDGPLAPIACASSNFFQKCDDCVDEKTCAVRLTMLNVRNAISDVLDRQTLADLRDMPRHLRKTRRAAAG
ncbi:Rrf2 family transcriptional regulator [Hyphomicrobium sp. MC1]|uniref:RrF2 family transcriptional regulator n=1 Tax=Hyphomicrobium sp. (strain MC1) TaxID=717785 RepID=UPI000213E924|nr:Rrf2 family transcriptional regulator [Hyphomicrobium sp. MC1]CCB66592.1 putative HTH-type transcriptional regulator rrf2-like [Hyphomicrobium sp. MC1]